MVSLPSQEESAPEGIPTLTLHHQYQKEVPEIRTDVEPPREMNGQTVYFDDDHHPIMENPDWSETFLFAPEEYTLWTQEVALFNESIKEPIPAPKQKSDTTPATKPGHLTTLLRHRAGKKGGAASGYERSLFDFANENESYSAPSTTETKTKKIVDASPRPFLSAPDSHLRDGSIVLQNGQVGFISDLKKHPTFNPMDLPYAQLSRLKAYIEVRESYHRLYD